MSENLRSRLGAGSAGAPSLQRGVPLAEAANGAARTQWSLWPLILVGVASFAGVAGAGAQTPERAGPAPDRTQHVREITPEQAVRMGLEASPRVRVAESEAAAARARHREARGGFLPMVAGQAGYTRLGGDLPDDLEFTIPGLDQTFSILPIERDRYTTELGFEQSLFTGGRLRNAARAAERGASAAERMADQARADVALEVQAAYWTLHGGMAALDAVEGALALTEEHVQHMLRRYEEGLVLRSDLLASQTRRSEVALERVEAENGVRVARLELNRLLGLPAAAEPRPVGAVPQGPLVTELDVLVEEALASSSYLQAMAHEVGALRAQAAVARGGRLPDLSFVSRYVYARPNPYTFTEQTTFRGTWEAGVAVRWSLFQGGAQLARESEAAARLRAAEARLQEAREMAAVDVARHYLEAQRAREAVEVSALNVEQAMEGLRVTREQFEEGVVLSSQVLEAERAYREAQARAARAGADLGLGQAALRHALGRVW
jgi:outer membrane protein